MLTGPCSKYPYFSFAVPAICLPNAVDSCRIVARYCMHKPVVSGAVTDDARFHCREWSHSSPGATRNLGAPGNARRSSVAVDVVGYYVELSSQTDGT
jgi:hypothetical protein